jgi:hypothetical protein
MGRAYSTNGEKGKAYRILMGKPEGRRSLERLRRIWANNIKTNLTDIASTVMDWTDLSQYKGQWRTSANTIIKLRVP